MYTPVSKRNTPARTGYVPVAQRQVAPVVKTQKPVEAETPFATTKLGVAKNTILGLPKAALDTAKSIGQGIARGYAATGQRAAKALKLVEGDTVDPRTFFGASPTAQKIGTAVFGKDKPFSAKTEDIEFLETFGIDPEVGAKTGGSITILLSALDLTGAGGGAKGLAGLSKTLKAAKTAEEAAEAMRAVRFADDIVTDYAPIFAKAKTTQEVKVALDAAMKLSDTTKVAGYVPVAERAVAEGVPTIPKTADDLVTTYKSAGQSKSLPEFSRADEELSNILTEMELSKAGERAMIPSREPGVDYDFHRVPSTFPEWVPEHLRRTDLFQKVMPNLGNIKYPKGSRQRELYDTILDELDSRLGVDTKVIRDNIKANEITSGNAKAGRSSTRRGADGAGSALKAEARAKGLPELPKFSQANDETISGTTGTESTIGQRKLSAQGMEAHPSPLLDKYSQPPVKSGLQLQSERSLQPTLPQMSKVVNEGEKVVRLSDESYVANHARVVQKTGRIQRIKESLGAITRSAGEGADKILGTISTRLKNIDPSLKTAIRDFEYNLANNTQRDRKSVAPFIKSIRDKNIPLRDYADLDLALKNGDTVKTQEIITKYGLEDEFAAVRATLEDLYRRADSVGYDIGYERNYFPRMIEDSAGMLEYLQKGEDWSLIDEAIKAKETELGRYLTTDEKATVVNTLVRGYPSGKITLSETGAMKARRIDIVDANLNQYYRDSVESLLRYVDTTNDAIEARRFFGVGKKTDEFANVEDSIGTYILNLMADGKVKPSQEKELREILLARFNAKGTNGITRIYKNIAYIDTMGSITSAITQLGDLAFALYKGGPMRTVKAFTKAALGKSDITRADIGIEKIAQEFNDSSRSANAVTKVFKLIGLEKMDAIGKETLINASMGKLRSLANNPTPEFMRKLEAVFGSDSDTLVQVTDDLKAGAMTENTKLLAFNELLDVQPVALSEMPEMYLKGGNGRIFYMLKTYTIKLFDVYRNEIFSQMRTNPVQATKNLIYLTGSLLLMNATADEIKDLILNRETSLKDRTVDNILRLMGFSKFTIYEARQSGAASAIIKTILPPVKLADALVKDATNIAKGEFEPDQAESIASIPLGGKLYYWWFGKGATKTEKKRKSKGDSGAGLPELPKLPSLPALPKLPKI